MKTKNTQENSQPDWEWVKYRLALSGYTFGKLAKIHGVKKTNFTNVKRVHSPKYERIIADYLNVDPWDLWPDRYDEAHNPNRISSRYQGHKTFLEHASTEINRKISKEKV